MRGYRLWALRLVSTLIGATLILVILELVFRTLPVSEPANRVFPSRDDPVVRYRPNEKRIYSAAWDFFIVNEVRTNNAGWVSDIDYVRDAGTPLVSFVGDSFVQGDHLPWQDTCHGRLSIRLDGQTRVYSFGHNAAPLSQYLGYAEHVRDTYRPDGLVVPIIENDFDQSFRHILKPTRHHMFFAFEELPDGELALVPPAPLPQEGGHLFDGLGGWLRLHSSLVRYRSNHVRDRLYPVWGERAGTDPNGREKESPFSPRSPAIEHPDVVAWAHRATDAFLHMLPERSGLNPNRIAFVVDGLRPMRYTEGWEHQLDGSYHDVVRRYFMDQARADGYEVIDMQPVFVDHYRLHQEPFNWTRDAHWNALGHGLCADQVARSRLMRGSQTAAPALSAPRGAR